MLQTLQLKALVQTAHLQTEFTKLNLELVGLIISGLQRPFHRLKFVVWCKPELKGCKMCWPKLAEVTIELFPRSTRYSVSIELNCVGPVILDFLNLRNYHWRNFVASKRSK